MPTDPNIILLPAVRISWPHVFEARIPKGSTKLFFDANFILDCKQHADTIKKIEQTIDRVALDKFLKKVPLKHKCLHDGNEIEDEDGYGDGVMYIVSKSVDRPAVVDSDRVTPLTSDSRKIYSGAYVNASIRLYAWAHETGGKGVSADLRVVQFLRDGISLGGSGPIDAQKELAGLPDDTGEVTGDTKKAPDMGDF